MTFGELKNNIRDLGFEEDSIITEYHSIILNACNRAINIVLKTVVEPHKSYFKSNNDAFKLPKDNQLNVNTGDDYEIDLPAKVIDLVPLLASHYVWLDDDVAKATYYWNEYDEFKQALTAEFIKPLKVQFHGGVKY